MKRGDSSKAARWFNLRLPRPAVREGRNGCQPDVRRGPEPLTSQAPITQHLGLRPTKQGLKKPLITTFGKSGWRGKECRST